MRVANPTVSAPNPQGVGSPGSDMNRGPILDSDTMGAARHALRT